VALNSLQCFCSKFYEELEGPFFGPASAKACKELLRRFPMKAPQKPKAAKGG
jgi:hypothetical protein